MMTPTPIDSSDREAKLRRFWTTVQKTDSCWIWTGTTLKHTGYGRLGWKGKYILAHRLSYVLFVGLIPEGLTIDHVKARGCMGGPCVNPAHLEAVTLAENVRRSKKDVCPKGHPLVQTKRQRRCNVCRAAYANSERGRAVRDAYKEKHREQHKQERKEWGQRNQERLKAGWQRWWKANGDRRNAERRKSA